MDSRQAFEKCAKSIGHLDLTRSELRKDWYSNSYVNDAWLIWQAGRSSMRDEAVEKCAVSSSYRAIESITREIKEIQP